MAKSKRMTSKKPARGAALEPLSAGELRWRCDPKSLPFESTAEVEPVAGVVGQDAALEALRFGLETGAPGQNVYVRGLSGTGRLTLVRRLVEEIRLTCTRVKDCCYVHNFAHPDQPRLIALSAGRGRDFRRRIDRLIDFVGESLGTALSSDALKSRRAALEQAAEKEVEQVVNPFEDALQASSLSLVRIQAGPVIQTTIHPVVDGRPVPPEEFEGLRAQGKISEEHYAAVRESYQQFEKQLAEIGEKVGAVRRRLNDELVSLLEGSARWILNEFVRDIREEYPESSVATFLSEIVDDIITHRLPELEKSTDFTELYRVNLLSEHGSDGTCPVVVENSPTMRNLLGSVDYQFVSGEEFRVSHMGIHAGSLLRADGGYLIIEVRDVLSEPGAWKALTRVLRDGRLEIASADSGYPWVGPSLKPEPIELSVKVILLGDSEMYYLLDAVDPGFAEQFKVLADFDSVMPRDEEAMLRYASILSRIASEEQLPPFDRGAVAAWIEHGARIAARRQRLSTRFGRLADIAREAAFVTQKAGRSRVSGDDVRAAVRRAKTRADLPSRRFREYVADGTIRIETQGEVVGQINGLAVLQAGPLIYGFPCRISATIGPGHAGVINIERESALSGAIHTKGFYILGGLLRHLLRTDHPLAFDASIAFEQSYGGIDGDSASGAEICCLLSALTDVPLRQDLAMTGAIDQMGHILAVGAVNEKIEGFFDACRDIGLSGTQGVIIPRANAGDLMLRDDVIAACAAGRFHVHAVTSVHEALELLSGMSAGLRDPGGRYPDGTLLAMALRRAREYWEKAARSRLPATSPSRLSRPTDADESAGGVEVSV